MKKTLALAAGLLLSAGVAVADHVTYDCATFGSGCNNRIPVSGTSGAMDTSTITIPDDGPCAGRRAKVFDINVGIDYNHTFNGDLDVTLTGPNVDGEDTTIELFTDIGGSSNDMCVELDDQSENGPITGQVLDCSDRQPETGPELCNFNGGNIGGATFSLDINDQFGGDSGQLNGWYIEVDCQTKGKAPLCAGDDGKGGRGLGSWANNGGGNGDDLPPRGQRGR